MVRDLINDPVFITCSLCFRVKNTSSRGSVFLSELTINVLTPTIFPHVSHMCPLVTSGNLLHCKFVFSLPNCSWPLQFAKVYNFPPQYVFLVEYTYDTLLSFVLNKRLFVKEYRSLTLPYSEIYIRTKHSVLFEYQYGF